MRREGFVDDGGWIKQRERLRQRLRLQREAGLFGDDVTGASAVGKESTVRTK
jgi:hypothetical protein